MMLSNSSLSFRRIGLKSNDFDLIASAAVFPVISSAPRYTIVDSGIWMKPVDVAGEVVSEVVAVDAEDTTLAVVEIMRSRLYLGSFIKSYASSAILLDAVEAEASKDMGVFCF